MTTKNKKNNDRFGYTSKEIGKIRILGPKESEEGVTGMYIKSMDWDNPAEVQKYKDLLAKYGITDKDIPVSPKQTLPPPPETKI
jgi:hypothetical protein